jgi:hypothetical protein
MKISPRLFHLALGAAIAGCANQSASTAGSGASPPAASFDGRYDGAIQVTGVVSGGNIQECATAPQISLQVKNNQFTYVQSHPNLPNSAAGVTAQNTMATYNAIIAADGSIRGDSGNLGGTIQGQVSANHMTGTINGLLCYYNFNADRT